MGNNRVPFEPDTVYHVYNHGNADDLLFREDKNYLFFLKRYKKYVISIVDTFAYCLMPNHFHFMVRIKRKDQIVEFFSDKNPRGFQNPEGLEDNLSKLISHQFGTLLNSYTKAYNKRYNRKGSLFRSSFHRKKVDSSRYYTQLIRYIHRNPVEHGFAKTIRGWPYSSYNSMLSSKPTLLKRKAVLKWFGGREKYIKLHKMINS